MNLPLFSSSHPWNMRSPQWRNRDIRIPQQISTPPVILKRFLYPYSRSPYQLTGFQAISSCPTPCLPTPQEPEPSRSFRATTKVLSYLHRRLLGRRGKYMEAPTKISTGWNLCLLGLIHTSTSLMPRNHLDACQNR